MEIFNFFRIFVSNLQIKLSVNSVILMNSVTITAPPPTYLLRPSRLALGRPWLRAGTACTLRVDSARSWTGYKARNAVITLSFPVLFPDVAASTPASSPRFLSPNQPRKSGVQLRLGLLNLFQPLWLSGIAENLRLRLFLLAAGDLD